MNKIIKEILIIIIATILIIFYTPMKLSNYMEIKGYNTPIDNIEKISIYKSDYDSINKFTDKGIKVTDRSDIEEFINIISNYTVQRSLIKLFLNTFGYQSLKSSDFPQYNISYYNGINTTYMVYPPKNNNQITIDKLDSNIKTLRIILGKSNTKKLHKLLGRLMEKYPDSLIRYN